MLNVIMNDTGEPKERELFPGLPPLLDSKQAAAILDVHPRTITRMCEHGELKAVRVRSVWRINRNSLLEFAGLM